MKCAAILTTALASLARHKLRSLLSAAGVAAGVMALVSMLAITEGAARESQAALEALGADNLILRGPGRSDPGAGTRRLSVQDGRQLAAAIPDLLDAGALRALDLPLAELAPSRVPGVLAVEAGWLRARQVRVRAGRPLSDLDDARAQRVCLLGDRLARELADSGQVGQRLRVDCELLEIVGILAPRTGPAQSGSASLTEAQSGSALAARDMDGSLFLPLTLASALDGGGPGPRASGSDRSVGAAIPVDEWSMRLRQGADLPRSALLVQRVLERLHGDLGGSAVVLPEELLRAAQQARRTFGLVLAAIACIALAVGGVGILNILLASVSERTREIGIRRSVGATRADIMLQFLAEALVLSAVGAACGLGAGAGCTRALGELAGWPVAVAPWSILLALGMAFGVGLVAGAIPALRAARVDPIIALRHA